MTGPEQVSRVLVAVDFQESSASAVSAAGALAAAFNATLSAVHAHTLDLPAYFTEAQMEALEAERELGRTRAAADLLEFAGRHTAAPVTPLIEEGTPAAVILRLAPAFDLVVLGTRHLHGPRRWWEGSVAETVVRGATVPVLVVPPGGPAVSGLKPGARIVAIGPGDARFDVWLADLASAIDGEVLRAHGMAGCAPDRLQSADLVVLELPAGSASDPQFHTIVHVLRECSHPVLFIPAAEAAHRARSS